MATIRGKIINPPSVKTEIMEVLKAEILIRTTGMYYQASSKSTFLSSGNAWFLPLDLSKINDIFTYPDPILHGQSIFRSRQTEQKIPLFFNGNESEDLILQTTTYTIKVNSSSCNSGGYCETFFTYEDEYGTTVSDSVIRYGNGSQSITFCSSSYPNITSTDSVGCSTCLPSLTPNVEKCNTISPPISANNEILYIDNGKKYQLKSNRNESNNYGWVPQSNDELFPYVERSDFDSFDFPQVTISGTRKIPITINPNTLCGPIGIMTFPNNGISTSIQSSYDRMNYNWIFGDNAGITFNPIRYGSTPSPLSGSMTSQEGVSSISNEDGQLLFYTNGDTVYNSGNTVMSNGTGLSSSGTSTQSSIIIPKPDSNKYYIFTTDFNGNPNGFEYSIVNMDLQGGLGQIETKNIKLINTPLTEKVTACSHSTEDAYWIITHTSGDSSYYSYKVNSAGLSGPIITNIGHTHNTARGYMKTSPDCTKLISVLYDEDIVDIFDFDASGGTLSNFTSITGKTFDVGPYGLEFSSDSSKFYVSEGASEKIYQYNLSYSAGTDILDNEITVGDISGSSLGALQMGPDEKIYIADSGTTSLHVIHRPNGLGVQCNFQKNGFSLSSSTITGTSSTWGLPNVVTDKALSCDRYVYITPRNLATFNFNFLVNNVNNVISPKKLSYYGEIYKYDQINGEFSPSALQTFNISHDSLINNDNNQLIISNDKIGDGEFIIKSYWDYDVNTLIAKQQNVRRNSVNTYKRGDLYGLYVPETDWYFINMLEASQPLFNSSVVPPAKTINSLVVTSVITESGQTKYNIKGLSDAIVSFNGNVLAKDLEYKAVTSQTGSTTGTTTFIPYVELLFDPLENQVLTYAYVKDGDVNDLLADLYIVEGSIKSGATGTQLESDRVFYNTTEGKYEFYLISVSSSDVVLSVNGSMLARDIEYFQSFSNSRRIILEEPLNTGDVIEAFYVPTNAIIGGIPTNSPQISWSINNAPLTTNGRFTVQFTTLDDINYENVIYSEVVKYVVGQKTYNKMITLTNAVAGDNFIYRVVNEKFYTPIVGGTIYSVKYSTTTKVQVLSNSKDNY
jgi:hypothetical protein